MALRGGGPDDEIGRWLVGLAPPDGNVYATSGSLDRSSGDADGADRGERLLRAITVQVHELARDAFVSWERIADGGSRMASPAELVSLLEPITAAAAVRFLAGFAAQDLAYGVEFVNREAALRGATRVVDLLGPGALWWSNHDTTIGAWNPITPCTFDGVVAGTDGTRFAVLLQLAED